YCGQEVVAISSGLRWHCHEQRVREGGFGDDLEVDVARRDRVASDEALSELPPDGPRIAPVERLLGGVEPGRIDVVLHVVALQVHLDGRVTYLVDHLKHQAVVKFWVGDR